MIAAYVETYLNLHLIYQLKKHKMSFIKKENPMTYSVEYTRNVLYNFGLMDKIYDSNKFI